MVERRFKALPRDHRGNSSLIVTRAWFVNNEIYKPFLLNSWAQGAPEKNEQST